jgi:hypothetical protein
MCKCVTKYIIQVPDEKAQCKHCSTSAEQLVDSMFLLVRNTQGKLGPLEKISNARYDSEHNGCKHDLMIYGIAVIKTWPISNGVHARHSRTAYYVNEKTRSKRTQRAMRTFVRDECRLNPG